MKTTVFVIWLAFAACAAGPAEASDPRTVVVLTFDDGRSDQLAAVNVLDEFGMRGTFFLVSGDIDQRDEFTMEQALALRHAGHEIGGHTLHHVRLTDLSDEEATLEVCADRQALTTAGLGPILSFSFPFSASDQRTAAIVKSCGYRLGRSQGGIDRTDCDEDCVYAESFVPENAFELRAPTSVRSDWTLADLQGFVLRAEAGGGVVVFTFHHVCDSCNENYKITPALFRKFAAWLAAREGRGTVVLPLSEAFGAKEPDSSPPMVVLTSPAPGARVKGLVELAAEAGDDDGVAEVGFFVDGRRVGAAPVPPYSVSWNVTSSDGPTAIITAHAVDLFGNEVVSREVAVVIEDASMPRTPDITEPVGSTRFFRLRWAPHGTGMPERGPSSTSAGGSSAGCEHAGSMNAFSTGLAAALILLWGARRRPH